jgi:hypothetical protein
MIKTFLLVVVFDMQTGEVLKIIEPIPGFETFVDCEAARLLLPVSKTNIGYRAWCLTPRDIRI